MPNAAGTDNHRVEGVDERNPESDDITAPEDNEQLDEGPAMSGSGAMPGGSVMNHWETASPNADATRPETMPHTASTPMPGETVERTAV